MQANARHAFKAIEALGYTVYDQGSPSDDNWNAHFILSGELQNADSKLAADYYQEMIREQVVEDHSEPGDWVWRLPDGRIILNAFGIQEEIHRILRRHGLHAEWIDGGTLGVYDA